MAMFITHARTAEELRVEVVSDIRRRIASLEGYMRLIVKSEREKAKYARVINELTSMLQFWTELEIASNKAKKET